MHSIISFSGGVDSTSLLLHLLNNNNNNQVHAVSFNYGQKHQIEIEFAKKNIKYLLESGFNVTHRIINISDVKDILDSSLTNIKTAIPDGFYMDENMKSTFVPNRIVSSIYYIKQKRCY